MDGDFRLREWLIQPTLGRASRDGQTVRLRPKVMDLLVCLAQKPGAVLSKDEILTTVWRREFVSESAMTRVVTELRHALGDDADHPTIVETIPKRGYRLIAPVIVDVHSASLLAVETKRGRTRLTPALVATAAVVLGAIFVSLKVGAPTSGATIAVLPFENLSGDPDRDYLADGLTEETSASIGQADPFISVIGRTTMRTYKATTKSLAQIGRELGADYLVEGSLLLDGAEVRVTSKLIRARDQLQLWSAAYETRPSEILRLQRDLSMAIAGHVRRRPYSERVDALARRQTRNVEAYDLYLRGRYLWNQLTPETNRRATEYYERAIALDPGYALALSGLADVLTGSPINSDVAPLSIADRARARAAGALRAQPDLAQTQTSFGRVLYSLDWDWPGAEAAFKRAIDRDPSYVLAHRMLGHVLSQMGRHDEAANVMRRARELDPLEPMVHAISAQIAYQARDYGAALEHARNALVVDPDFWIAFAQQAQAYAQSGQLDRALEALTSATRLRQSSMNHALRGYVLARLGRQREARDVLSLLDRLSHDRYVPPAAMALVHAGLDDSEAVFEWLEKAQRVRDVQLMFLPVDPKWDAYRSDSRFDALLRRCGFTRTVVATAQH
jgi:TolB-like protein/DNA-binding winged helix-turn-helix (wHTH) protein/Flp pilus assembly protein TadD